MRTWAIACSACGTEFEAKSQAAKWCSSACRKRVQRSPRGTAESPADESEPVDQGLIESVRKELEEANRVNTFAGQLALTLARRLPKPDESGISSLSKELRTVMAAALEGVTPPSAEGEPEKPDEVDDEVTRARRQREEARQAAGLA